MSFEPVLVPVEAPVCGENDNRSVEPASVTSKSQLVKKMRLDLQLPWDFLKNPSTPYQLSFVSFSYPAPLAPSDYQSSFLVKSPSSFWLTVFYALLFRYTQQATLDLDVTLVDSSNLHPKPLGIALTLSELESMQTLAHQVVTALEVGLPLPAPATVAFTYVTENTAISPDAATQLLNRDMADLHLVLIQSRAEIHGTLGYNAHLFRPETVERLLGHLGQLAEGAIAAPNAPIASLPLLTPAEKQQMLVEWGSPRVEYPRLPIFTTIEAHAAERPGAIAVRFQEQTLTYGELNQRANQLAHYLVTQGVTPGTRVAACFEPSLDVSVALLAIFKAGGTYVPLDPGYPAERLSIILEDTQPQVLLTQTRLQSVVPALVPTVFCLDQDWVQVATLPTDNLSLSLDLNQTAYIVYTSGTTGKPKGVMASHGNLVNYIRVAVDTYRFGPDLVMPSMARYTFSITFFELVLPLVAGGQLVILERDRILDFKYMLQLLEEINTIHASPSLLRKLIAYINDQGLDLSRFDNLKHVSSGGDLVSADLQEAMKRTFRNAEIYVIYGCSEVSCMGCTFFAGDRTVTKTWVGKAFPNVTVRLFDKYLNPVPIGMVGEICFSGDGITQGYLNREELTQERFILIDGQRFYRTGDLGRYDADGNVEILGRSDFQIQLRGMRVEPGEIEITLRQCPGVRDSVVALKPLRRDEEGLVAYVVLDPAQPATTDTMRRFLQAKLPDYMVPSAFQVLEALPLNMNGKVDRKALPDPDLSQGADTPYVAPRTDLEQALAAAWANVLGVEQVGIESDFFMLGGHSLLAAQAIAQIQDTLQIDVPLRRLFEFPTIAGLAGHIENAPQERHIIPKRPDPNSALLSFAQQRLWFLDQLEPGSYTYHICKAIRLQGPLNVEALQQTLDAIVERHEPLRTCFIAEDGIPHQRILPHEPFLLAQVDLSQQPPAEQATALERMLLDGERRPFNLSADIMLRATLIRLQPDEHVFQVVVHHIASDGISMEVMFEELRRLYDAFCAGRPNPLPPLPVQYADFAEWQRQWFSGAVLEQYTSYWKEALQGFTTLELPTDYPRPAIQTYSGQSHSCTLPRELAQTLKQVSQKEGATLFMTLLAAFKVLLGRLSGQEDIVIGSPIAERDRPELQALIGFFINTVVLRTDLSGSPTFKELLGRVRQSALGAYAHQEMPFEKLVEELQPERDLSRTPIFQVWFNMFNFDGIPIELAELTVESMAVAEPASKFDLTLYVGEKGDELWINLVSNADLFSAARMEEVLAQYTHLLAQIAQNPGEAIAAYSLVTPRSQSLLPSPEVILAAPHQDPVPTLISQWAQQSPDWAAICQGDQIWTYEALTQRATIIAQNLVLQGIQPGDAVAVTGHRSFGLIASMLGIFLSGSVLVTLDPTLPTNRKQVMLDTAQAKILITVEGLSADSEELTVAIAHLTVTAHHGTLPDHEEAGSDIPLPAISPDQAAYIFFTSGTTGTPKGVLGVHKGLAHFLSWQRQTFAVGVGDRVAQRTGLSFDVVLRDIFLPLTSGATLCLPELADEETPGRMMAWLDRQRITLMHLVPTLAKTWLMDVPDGITLETLRWIFLAGEPLSAELVQQWRSTFPKAGALVNLYGPTETTLAKCYHPVDTPPLPGVQPVGRTLPQTQALVLSSANQLCGVGEIGEIVIRTPFRSLGYLNASVQQQQLFAPNPFRQDKQDLVYYTGDLGRYRPDGLLDILGRRDHQVKINGVRIELGEVEATLMRHPSVRQCVVIAREDEPGQKRLVAYVVSHDPKTANPRDWRQFLQQTLMGSMVPSAFVSMETIPMTPNGKIDRKALPVPDLSVDDHSDTYVAPRTKLERQLVEIWEKVLNVQPIGIRNNFFELGGNSLLSVQILMQMEKQVGTSLPLATFLKAPTIEAMAQFLRNADGAQQDSGLVPLREAGSKPPLFCLYGVLLYRQLAEHLDPDQPVYGVFLEEEVEALRTGKAKETDSKFSSVPAIAHQYLKSIRTLQPHGPYYLLGESFGGVVAYEMAQQLEAEGETVALVALLDSYAPNTLVDQPTLTHRLGVHLKLALQQGPSYIVSKVQPVLARVLAKFRRRQPKPVENTKRTVGQNTSSGQPPRDVRRQIRRRARQGYRLQPYHGKVLLFRAQQRDPFDQDPHKDLGWGEFARDLEITGVPGNHLSILEAPNVAVITDQLSRHLHS